MFKKNIKKIYFKFSQETFFGEALILYYKFMNKKPWSFGYNEYKWRTIIETLNNKLLISAFKKRTIKKGFGVGIDERVVEYPWVFANFSKAKRKLKVLDAGSVFNYRSILTLGCLKNTFLYIFNYNPEIFNYNEKGISYIYGDLRCIPFRDKYFEVIVSISTLEHIDMDNSLYGYDLINSSKKDKKSYDYLKVVKELYRVLSQNGEMFITFPFGQYKNYGFFQQFDQEMVARIEKLLNGLGKLEISYIKYSKQGWGFTTQRECSNSVSFNPHTGEGRGEDGAAHCRAICCIKFIKK